MTSKDSYYNWLKEEMGKLIDSLDLDDLPKQFLHSRWLDQVLWMEKKAASAQKRYYLLRLTAIVGGVTLPALVGLNISGEPFSAYLRGMTFCLSLLVAISVAVEGFFNYGERWRHYRRTVEDLKREGWQFFQLSGPYRGCQDHAKAYPVFAGRTENLFQQEVEVYVTEVVKEKKKERGEKP